MSLTGIQTAKEVPLTFESTCSADIVNVHVVTNLFGIEKDNSIESLPISRDLGKSNRSVYSFSEDLGLSTISVYHTLDRRVGPLATSSQ